MPYQPSAGTPAEWDKYITDLKALNNGLRKAGIEDGVWDERSRRCRSHVVLSTLPYPERMAVVRKAWYDVLSEEERMEVGNDLLQQAPTFTKEQLHYAGKAAVDYFLKHDPKAYIDTVYPSTLRGLINGPKPWWRGGHLSPATYHWSGSNGGIYGNKADMIIIDDPINTVTKGKKVKTAKPKPKTYNTVGVRFLRGHNLAKVYTYKVPKKTKLGLGEEVIVPSTFDGLTTNGIGVVVELHKEQQDTTYGIDYKFVTGRIARIAQ